MPSEDVYRSLTTGRTGVAVEYLYIQIVKHNVCPFPSGGIIQIMLYFLLSNCIECNYACHCISTTLVPKSKSLVKIKQNVFTTIVLPSVPEPT